MTNNFFKTAFFVLVIVILLIILFNRGCEKPVHNTTTTTTIYDTILTHDTITRIIPATSFVRVVVRDTMILHDTTEGELVIDTLGCIKGEFKTPDSAKFEWQACSIDLPLVLREPINWEVKYVAPPKIVAHEIRVDTVVSPRFWRELKIGSCCIGIGIAAGALVWEYAR
jgi:hypothetical protein